MTLPEHHQARIPEYKRTLFHFKVMYSGWEYDENAWVVELTDGSKVIVTTSHASAYVAKVDEFQEKIREYEVALEGTRTALQMVSGAPVETYRHEKRGTTYTQLGRGALQASGPVYEGATLVAYVAQDDGRLWFCPAGEFDEGRFTKVE